jgi:hypothetical protein
MKIKIEVDQDLDEDQNENFGNLGKRHSYYSLKMS